MKSPRPAAALLAVLLAVPPQTFACGLFGAVRSEAVQTGSISGSTRTEKLVARYDGTSPFVVKLFVGPAGAAVKLRLITDPKEMEKFDGIARTANAVLNPPLMTRGSRGVGGAAPVVVDSLKVGDIDANLLDVTKMSWGAIKTRFRITPPNEDRAYEEWVKRVGPEEGRAIYAAYIDVSQVQDKAQLKQLFALAVTIPYSGSGDKMRKDVALDKWLEYKGAHEIAVGFGTDWTKDDALVAFQGVMINDWDLADDLSKAYVQADGGDTNIMVTQPNIVTFTLRGASAVTIVSRNSSYILGPHNVPRPKPVPFQQRRSDLQLDGVKVPSDPFKKF